MKTPFLNVHPSKHLMTWMMSLCLGVYAIAGSAQSVSSALPDAATLQRQAQQQLKNSSSAIERAEQQSRGAIPTVPGFEKPAETTTAPLPDPSAVAKAINRASQEQDGPALFVLVSFSMPTASLDQLAHQAVQTGASLVLRGVVENSLQKTALRSAEMIKRNPGLQLQVDPTLYQRFSVSTVPTFILVRSVDDLKACSKACDGTRNVLTASGDVSLDYALEKFAQSSPSELTNAAELFLKRIRSKP